MYFKNKLMERKVSINHNVKKVPFPSLVQLRKGLISLEISSLKNSSKSIYVINRDQITFILDKIPYEFSYGSKSVVFLLQF